MCRLHHHVPNRCYCGARRGRCPPLYQLFDNRTEREHSLEFRPLLGNRIYGCDDCQLVCPVNRAGTTDCANGFPSSPTVGRIRKVYWRYFCGTKPLFLRQTEGSAIRRIGYQRWQRESGSRLRQCALPSRDYRGIAASGYQCRPRWYWSISNGHWHSSNKKQQQADKANRQQQRLIRIIAAGLQRDA